MTLAFQKHTVLNYHIKNVCYLVDGCLIDNHTISPIFTSFLLQLPDKIYGISCKTQISEVKEKMISSKESRHPVIYIGLKINTTW